MAEPIIKLSDVRKITSITNTDYVLMESATHGTVLVQKAHFLASIAGPGILPISSTDGSNTITNNPTYVNISVSSDALTSNSSTRPLQNNVITVALASINSRATALSGSVSVLSGLFNSVSANFTSLSAHESTLYNTVQSQISSFNVVSANFTALSAHESALYNTVQSQITLTNAVSADFTNLSANFTSVSANFTSLSANYSQYKINQRRAYFDAATNVGNSYTTTLVYNESRSLLGANPLITVPGDKIYVHGKVLGFYDDNTEGVCYDVNYIAHNLAGTIVVIRSSYVETFANSDVSMTHGSSGNTVTFVLDSNVTMISGKTLTWSALLTVDIL